MVEEPEEVTPFPRWILGVVQTDDKGGSKLPWILLFIAIGGAVYAGVLAASQAEEAREAKREAEALRDSANAALADLDSWRERLPIVVDSINGLWRGRLDSIAILPPDLPAPDPRIRAFLDTVRVTRELRLAIDAQARRLQAVEAQNRELRQIVVDLRAETDRAIDSLTAHWLAEVNRVEVVLHTVERALEAAEEESDRWETAYYASRMSVLDRLKWAGVGFAAGYLTNELTGRGDTEVRVTSAQEHDMITPPLLTDPHVSMACLNWGRKRYC